MSPKARNIADLIVNLIITVSVAVAAVLYFSSGPDVLGSQGAECFKYFTTDSNLLAALASLVMLRWNVLRLRRPGAVPPRWVTVLKYAGTSAAALTLVTVLVFLAPLAWIRNGFSSFLMFFSGNVFVLHLLAPLLALASFLFLEPEGELRPGDRLWAVLPAVLYSLLYLTMVVILKVWTDWYGFTFGGKLRLVPVVMLAMYAAAYAIAAVLERGRRAGLSGEDTPC